jgi:hypothetical protein
LTGLSGVGARDLPRRPHSSRPIPSISNLRGTATLCGAILAVLADHPRPLLVHLDLLGHPRLIGASTNFGYLVSTIDLSNSCGRGVMSLEVYAHSMAILAVFGRAATFAGGRSDPSGLHRVNVRHSRMPTAR